MTNKDFEIGASDIGGDGSLSYSLHGVNRATDSIRGDGGISQHIGWRRIGGQGCRM